LRRCAAIKANGERCKADALPGSDQCWSHHADYAEERRRRASKGGKTGGRGRSSNEIQEVKRELRRIIKALEDGTIEPKVGNAIFVGWSKMHQYLELERSVKETEELTEMVEELWQEHEQHRRVARREMTGGPRL
jgi:hypothetical protein